MGKVYVCHDDGRFDFSDATRFGELQPITHRDFYPDNVDAQILDVEKRARMLLTDFDPYRDYLCLVGSPLMVSLCSMTLGRMFPDRSVMVLRFDKQERQYYAVKFP